MSPMSMTGAGEDQTQIGCELFFGSIKSFNTRRGFGFVSCEETAQLYGRDVYLAKDEAMALANALSVKLNAPETSNEKSKTSPVQEGDFLSFHVKLSTEGFPQAIQVRKIRRLRGVVSEPASSTADGIIIVSGDDDSASEELLGVSVRLPQSACGQLQLIPNDEVAVCCVTVAESDGQALEAHRLELLRTSRVPGSVLGCFSLRLPRPVNKSAADVEDSGSTAASSGDSPDVELRGHALTDQVFVSEMPSDFTVPDLMRFFGKIGGQADTANSGNGNSMSGFTCISFSATEHVAKFLTHTTHTISENGITQLAQLGPCFHRQCGSSCCFCLSRSSLSTSEVPVASDDRVLHTTPEMIQSHPQITCAPCGAVPSGDHMSDARGVAAQFESAPVVNMPMLARSSLPDWRCIHGSIVVAAASPEMIATGENGCSAFLQWPTVVHASAYAVELLDQCTGVSQRFMRAATPESLPVLTDLRIDGLRPSHYAACVRCVAHCGCESMCSPWSFLQLGCGPAYGAPPLATALNVLPPSAPAPLQAVFPDVCPPPPSAPPSLLSTSPVAAAGLPPIPEDSADAAGVCNDEVLLLD